jgi:hypothetical protein
MTTMLKRSFSVASVVILFLMLIAATRMSSAYSLTTPTIDSASSAFFQNSLTLPSGSQTYLYAYSDGGTYATSVFSSNGATHHYGKDSAGERAVGVTLTQSASNSFTTGDEAYTIGGVGISGYTSVSVFHGQHVYTTATTNNVYHAHVTFTVSASNSLVVVVMLGSSQSYLSYTGATLSVATSSINNPSCDPLLIAYGYLPPSTYTITETTSPNSPVPANHLVDYIGVFVFS